MSTRGISLEEVLAHNKALKKGPKGLVGVFGKISLIFKEAIVLRNFKLEEPAGSENGLSEPLSSTQALLEPI